MRRLISLFLVLIVIGVAVLAPAPAKAQTACAPNTAYTVGQLVTYGGKIYKCIQSHPSQVGWEPPNVPALWGLQSGTVPTNTATKVATAGPTKTPTKVPTAGPSPTRTPTKVATKTNTPSGPTPTPNSNGLPKR